MTSHDNVRRWLFWWSILAIFGAIAFLTWGEVDWEKAVPAICLTFGAGFTWSTLTAEKFDTSSTTIDELRRRVRDLEKQSSTDYETITELQRDAVEERRRRQYVLLWVRKSLRRESALRRSAERERDTFRNEARSTRQHSADLGKQLSVTKSEREQLEALCRQIRDYLDDQLDRLEEARDAREPSA